MKADELTVKVSAELSVSQAQAYRALKLVEWYLNDNHDYISVKKTTNGSLILGFTSLDERIKEQKNE